MEQENLMATWTVWDTVLGLMLAYGIPFVSGIGVGVLICLW